MELEKNNQKQILCEIFSRVSGYYRPINQYNKGKKEEFRLRINYSVSQFQETVVHGKNDEKVL